MKDPIRKVEFVPKFSIFTRTNKKRAIGFTIANNFDFSSIKNVIVLKFVTSKVKAILKLFSEIKDNNLCFPKSLIAPQIKLLSSLRTKLLFRDDLKAKIKLFSSAVNNRLNFMEIIAPKITLYSKGTEKFSFKSLANESIHFLAKSNSILKFTNYLNSLVNLYASARNGKIKFSSKADVFIGLFLKPEKIRLPIVGNVNATIKESAVVKDNQFKFNTIANATVYRPVRIQTIYNVKLEDLFYKTIDEIFYGEKLE